MKTNKQTKTQITCVSKLVNLFLLLFFLTFSKTFAQTTVTSLSALKPYLNDNNVNVKLAPGTYTITAADIIAAKFSNPILLFEGNNSTYDFTAVKINFTTDVFNSFGSVDVKEIQILGNNNVLMNLKMVDVGSIYDRPNKTALGIAMDGAYNRIEGFNMTVKGSQPYGYGDAFGKGSSYTIKHYKHSAILVRGESNHVKNCTIIHRAYGHAIFMQAANNAKIEGCYVEGEVRKTDDMLRETGSSASNINFMTDWGYKLPAGHMMSLQEEGIRAYNGGTTIINGVTYERGTNNVTVLNCTVKNMRGGVTLTHATGTKYVEGCTTIGCERGYAIGSGAIVNCSGDALYGPVLGFDYSTDRGANVDITVLSNANAYNGSNSLAYIGGSGHTITFKNAESSVKQNLKVIVSGEQTSVRHLNGANSGQNNLTASKISITNRSQYPVALASLSSLITGESCGIITNQGTNNTLTKITCNTNLPTTKIVQIKKRNASTFAIDGNSGGANGQNVYLWSSNSSNVNQHWVEIDRGNGYYSYQKENTNYCIDGNSGGANRQNVYLWTCNENNQNQQWKKVDMGSGYFRLEKRNAPGFSLDGGSGGANGQNIGLYDSSSSSQNLQWSFTTLNSSITSREPLEQSTFSIYPNPVVDVFTFDVNDKEISTKTVGKIYDNSGMVIQSFQIDASNPSISVKDLKSGIYLIYVEGENKSYTTKFIKQ